jgi:dipeptidyl aminopeptidase/acylaminoacyl peptidase
MKTPLLLIHGEADNNSGTFPLESHGYRARESILHMLWEQDQWLEKYVKIKPSL